MSRKIPTRMPIARAPRALSSSLLQKKAPSLQPSTTRRRNPSVARATRPTRTATIQCVASVQVADVAEFMADDALELLAIHRLEQAARHDDRCVARVATRRECVLAPIRDDVRPSVTGICAATDSSWTTFTSTRSFCGSASWAPARLEDDIRPVAVGPDRRREADAAATAAVHNAGTGLNVRVTAMISAVAATMPIMVTISRKLFRRLDVAWASNVPPEARRAPNDAMVNVTIGRTTISTTQCPTAGDRPRVAS